MNRKGPGCHMRCPPPPPVRASLGRTSQVDSVPGARNLLLGDSDYRRGHCLQQHLRLSLAFRQLRWRVEGKSKGRVQRHTDAEGLSWRSRGAGCCGHHGAHGGEGEPRPGVCSRVQRGVRRCHR